jgi:hypothetical protein
VAPKSCTAASAISAYGASIESLMPHMTGSCKHYGSPTLRSFLAPSGWSGCASSVMPAMSTQSPRGHGESVAPCSQPCIAKGADA